MTDNPLERYKEALRTGHVAVLRGRLNTALAAYREAASIAVDRAAPRSAIGGVHLRLGDPQAALTAYDEALALASDDDAALLGRAQALAALERPGEAASTYERLAEVRAAGGKLSEALEVLRRALELEPSGQRRHRHQELARQLRLAAGDEVTERALAKALRLLDDSPADQASPPAPVSDQSSGPPSAPAVDAAEPPREVATEASRVDLVTEIPPRAADGPDELVVGTGTEPQRLPAGQEPEDLPAAPEVAWPAADPLTAEPEGVTAEPGNAPTRPEVAWPAADPLTTEPPLASVPAARPVADLVPPAPPPAAVSPSRPAGRRPGPDGEALSIAADEAARHGDAGGAVVAAMAAARAFRAAGHAVAALDVCIQALAAGPGDVSLHLVIAELQAEQGWPGVAAETYSHLLRLTELDGDPVDQARVLAAARAALPGDARFADTPG